MLLLRRHYGSFYLSWHARSSKILAGAWDQIETDYGLFFDDSGGT